MSSPSLSVVIVAYNMARELPRTILSLSARMQRGIARPDYELIVIDNDSEPKLDEEICMEHDPDVIVHRARVPSVSPVSAINQGLQLATGSLIGVWIDGARLASPGLLAAARTAAKLHPRPVIGTLSFHLGPDVQRRSIQCGYSKAVEDELLQSVDWTRDGYRLFSISSLGGSSSGGWFMPISETGSLFLTRAQWDELGGYDERFQMPGGGLANLELWRRAVMAPESQPIILLGEGTFHQLHGGAATSAPQRMFPLFQEEYRAIHGESYRKPEITPLYFGSVPTAALESLAWSASQAHNHHADAGSIVASPVFARVQSRTQAKQARISHKDYNLDRQAPIAVGGLGGSGTRVVSRLLMELGVFMGSDLNDSADNLTFTLLFNRPEILYASRQQFRELVEIFVASMIGGPPLTRTQEEVLQRLETGPRQRYSADWLRERVKALVSSRTYEAPLDGTSIWGWKEPNTHITISRLQHELPRMRYIHVIRNGLDIAFSANQKQLGLWGRSFLNRPVALTPSDSLSYWCEAHRRVLAACAPMAGRFHLLNFDQLCTEPSGELRRLLAFLQLEVSDSGIQRLISLVAAPTSIGRFKDHDLSVFSEGDLRYAEALGFDTTPSPRTR